MIGFVRSVTAPRVPAITTAVRGFAAKSGRAGLAKKEPYPSLLSRVQSLNAGTWVKPEPWQRAAALVPPTYSFKRGPKPDEIVFPEDKLYKTYFKNNPDAKLEVFRRRATATGEEVISHRAVKFVNTQMKYIEEGYSEEDAYAMTDKMMKREKRRIEMTRQFAQRRAIESGPEEDALLAMKQFQDEEAKALEAARARISAGENPPPYRPYHNKKRKFSRFLG